MIIMKYTKKIVDVTTGEETFEPYTAQEIAEVEAVQAQAAIDKTKRDAAQAIKDADKAALLAKLGITADEAKLLLA